MGLAWLTWVRDGEWGDTDLLAVNLTQEGARKWCNENRRLSDGTPITWKEYPDQVAGMSRVVLDLSHRKVTIERHYFLEPRLLGE